MRLYKNIVSQFALFWIFTKLQNRHETARPFERYVSGVTAPTEGVAKKHAWNMLMNISNLHFILERLSSEPQPEPARTKKLKKCADL